jgi:hypothetical protein
MPSNELYELAKSLEALKAALAEDNHRRQIEAIRLEQRRDDERRELIGLLERLRNGIEAQGRGLEDLPSRQLAHIEKKIYELRVARYEASKAGVEGALPLPLPAAHFEITEHTQQVALHRKDDDIVVPGAVVRAAGWVARRGWPILVAVAGGGALGHWLAALSKAAR